MLVEIDRRVPAELRRPKSYKFEWTRDAAAGVRELSAGFRWRSRCNSATAVRRRRRCLSCSCGRCG